MIIKVNKSKSILRCHITQKNFVLPSVSVGVSETIGEEVKAGWQQMSAMSLQQSFKLWHFWSQ